MMVEYRLGRIHIRTYVVGQRSPQITTISVGGGGGGPLEGEAMKAAAGGKAIAPRGDDSA
jgi:hypothetical protein